MLTRSRFVFGLAASLSSLILAGSASAQMMGLGQQIDNQIMNGAGWTAGTPYPQYGTGQFFYHPYQGQSMGYGGQPFYYQPPPSRTASLGLRRGFPFVRGGRTVFQQPVTTWTRPRYDQQLQPTSYTAPAVQRYQIPAEYAGTPAGYVINYGGRNYISGSDGTMTPYNGPVAPR